MLLENCADTAVRNGDGQTAIAVAVTGWSSRTTTGQVEVARLLIKAGADINELLGPSKSPALHIAIGHGLIEIVKMLTRTRTTVVMADHTDRTAFQAYTDALAQGKVDEEIADRIAFLLTKASNGSNSTSDTESSSSIDDTFMMR